MSLGVCVLLYMFSQARPKILFYLKARHKLKLKVILAPGRQSLLVVNVKFCVLNILQLILFCMGRSDLLFRNLLLLI